MKYIYGIDIGGTTIKIGLFAEDGTLKEKWKEYYFRYRNSSE